MKSCHMSAYFLFPNICSLKHAGQNPQPLPPFGKFAVSLSHRVYLVQQSSLPDNVTGRLNQTVKKSLEYMLIHITFPLRKTCSKSFTGGLLISNGSCPNHSMIRLGNLKQRLQSPQPNRLCTSIKQQVTRLVF